MNAASSIISAARSMSERAAQVARLLETLLGLRVAGRRYQHAGLKPGPRHLVLVGQVISAEQPPQTVESEVDLPGEQASLGELQLQPRVGDAPARSRAAWKCSAAVAAAPAAKA